MKKVFLILLMIILPSLSFSQISLTKGRKYTFKTISSEYIQKEREDFVTTNTTTKKEKINHTLLPLMAHIS